MIDTDYFLSHSDYNIILSSGFWQYISHSKSFQEPRKECRNVGPEPDLDIDFEGIRETTNDSGNDSDGIIFGGSLKCSDLDVTVHEELPSGHVEMYQLVADHISSDE